MRWIVAAAATALMAVLGTVYSWSLYAQPLATAYGWSASTRPAAVRPGKSSSKSSPSRVR